ncbi:MAG: SUF system Fe-S cluster assembly protein [Rhizomicrobium sp.]
MSEQTSSILASTQSDSTSSDAVANAPDGFVTRAPADLPTTDVVSQPVPPVGEGEDEPVQVQAAVSSAVDEAFTNAVIASLKTVYDPEIPVDIYELGLIYLIDISEAKDIIVDMTLTAPGCPVAGEMPIMVENAVKMVDGVGEVTVNMTFDPPWTPERMSDEARVALNMF